MATAKKNVKIEIPEIEVEVAQFVVLGDRLIMHKFSKKAQQEIEDKQQGKAKKAGKQPRDPHQEYMDSIYWFRDGKRVGFPSAGFKAAMVRAGKLQGYTMTDLRQMFFVRGQETDDRGVQLTEILTEDGEKDGLPVDGNGSVLHDVMAKISGGTWTPRYRALFPEWFAVVEIEYLPNVINAEQLANLLNYAGFSVGVGDWRPERGGDYGRFRVASGTEARKLLKKVA